MARKMDKMNIPNYLTPIESLTASVEVVGAVREKTDSEGVQKRSPVFDGALGWVVPVEIVRGTRTKRLPNGDELNVLDTDTVNVTVWNNSIPSVKAGDYVAFVSPMVGAVESSLFVQALGVTLAANDELSALFGDADE